MFSNGSFEDGWTDIIPENNEYGWLVNQIPTDWKLRWISPGDKLFGSDDVAHGVPECVHKHANQLPPNQQPGQDDALILDGLWTYKPFHNGLSFGVELWQEVTGLKPGSICSVIVPIRIHANNNKHSNEDQYLAESGVWLLDSWNELPNNECQALSGKGDWVPFLRERMWPYIPGVKPDGWSWFYHGSAAAHEFGTDPISITVPDSGSVCILIRMKSKWDLPIDFFIDDVSFTGVYEDGGTEPPIEPPPSNDLEERVDELETITTAQGIQISVLTAQVAELSKIAHTHDDLPPGNVVDLKFEHGDLFTDVSKYNTDIDWTALSFNDVEGAIVRATSGKRYSSTDPNGVDLMFWQHISAAQSAGLHLGAYFFLTNEESIDEQIDRFYGTLLSAANEGYIFPLGVFCDVEGEYSPQTESEIRYAAEKLVERCPLEIFGQTKLYIDGKLIHNRTGMYSGAWWWNRIINKDSTWPMDMNLMCWSAWYVGIPLESLPSPDTKFGLMYGWDRDLVNFWQFTSSGGKLVGQDFESLDLNYSIHQKEEPSGDVVDILEYVRGVHKTQFDKEYILANGVTGTETVQIWHLDENNWLHIKSDGQFWHLGLKVINGEEYIVFYEDTSESPTRWFSQAKAKGEPAGAWWLPRYMVIGVWYDFPKYVQHYTKENFDNNGVWSGDCVEANGGDVVDKMKLLSKPYKRLYDIDEELEVITIEWRGGEQYDFGGGNVAFRNVMGDTYWFKDWLYGREDKIDEVITPNCV